MSVQLSYILIFLQFNAIVWSIKTFSRIKRAPVINGSPIKISKAYYFASIVEKDISSQKWSPVCGASIITNSWLLTAAHCIQPPLCILKIRTGIDEYFLPRDKENDRYLHDISHVLPHFAYRHMNQVNFNDIGLIKLKAPIERIPKLQAPIKLPFHRLDLKDGSTLTVLGFGIRTYEENDTYPVLSVQLLSGKVGTIKKEDCEKIYKNWNISQTDHHFCATSKKYEVAKGDSGGPAVYNSHLIGIISSGGQGRDHYPGLFVDVRKYIHWIRYNVGPKLVETPNSSCIIS